MPHSTYFHCAPNILASGSILEPGNWGRVLNAYETQNGQVQMNAVRESLFELTRQIHTPDQPSRLNCLFALPTLEVARQFRDAHQHTNLIYEVVPLDWNAPTHFGDYELASRPYQGRYFDQMFHQAREYWTRIGPPRNPEILFSCPVRVISCPEG